MACIVNVGLSYTRLGFNEKFILSILLVALYSISYVVTQNVNIQFDNTSNISDFT
jgi:hypothetical protein